MPAPSTTDQAIAYNPASYRVRLTAWKDILAVLTADFLAGCMKCLSFGKIDGKFDTAIKGYGLDLKVSEVANTVLKEPKVGKNIPTVAKMTQGEVVKFAAGAAAAMRADGCNVLVEGREQTLNHVSACPPAVPRHACPPARA